MTSVDGFANLVSVGIFGGAYEGLSVVITGTGQRYNIGGELEFH
jgi:hypothetical protein